MRPEYYPITYFNLNDNLNIQKASVSINVGTKLGVVSVIDLAEMQIQQVIIFPSLSISEIKNESNQSLYDVIGFKNGEIK